jgi:hypothetical protein
MRPLPLIALIVLSLLSGAELSCAPADDFCITLERRPYPWYSVTILATDRSYTRGKRTCALQVFASTQFRRQTFASFSRNFATLLHSVLPVTAIWKVLR